MDPDQAVLGAALGAVGDDEFLRGDEMDEEVPEPIAVEEHHKAAAQSWLDVLQADRDSYQKEATDCLLHKVQVMEVPVIENLLSTKLSQRWYLFQPKWLVEQLAAGMYAQQ